MPDSSSSALSGPDFAAGVPANTLQEGAPLLGHANGEAVLLARSNGQVYAIGATCTHYGGPLAEGLIVGDTIRCPWHHACFSLRTGEALGAPALDPVSCFHVNEREGKIFVENSVSKAEQQANTKPSQTSATETKDTPKSVVIVGGGAAGVAAAEMLRRHGYTGRLHLLDACSTLPVDRPNLSKDYLAGNAPEEWVNLRSPDFYKQHDIDLVLDAYVSEIDTKQHTVKTRDGKRFEFDRLLLATGAEPVRLEIPGAELPHVHYLRSLDDSRSIIKAALQAKRAVVIGASFIGLEVAASLRTRNLEVHVVAPEARPLVRIVGDELGTMVQNLHEEHGVTFHLKSTVARIEPQSVRLSTGDALEADFVVVGVGVRPVIALAEAAGLSVDNGVVVNEYLETSIPGIFAAGDIARWPDPHSGQPLRVEHWVVAERLGQCAARNILGHCVPFNNVPFFWSQHYDVTIGYVGHAKNWDRLDIDGDPSKHDCKVTYQSGGQTLAVATVGRDMDSLRAEHELEQQTAT